MSLSDKINDGANTEGWHKVIYVDDIKEAVRELKESISDWVDCDSFNQKIEDIFGEDLT